ncbi:zinc finger CCCH domain-containing protein 29-like [Lycium ferocissimum]|uniref:zinc finger CCCH domain-containing protein 29-like n=1 Tax=Lycium ferocissimum TaxID=112874 RepID=UPI002814B6E7|nr:zinc finger CCCH domain-containing protein 29-like [Lycium ferocissimum]
MCTGSKSKLCPFDLNMDKKDGPSKNCSKLLELSASDDLSGFICEVEKGCAVDEFSFWYGKRFDSKKMGFEERTPLMIASMYGSTEILKYIIGTGKVDVNRACGSDGATALHCAAAGGSDSSIEVVKILVDASADVSVCDASGNKPCDVIASVPKSLRNLNSKRKSLELLLNGSLAELADHEEEQGKAEIQMAKEGSEKKEYPIDTSLPDINDGIYGSDDFRMYCFKVKPCSRAYSHDWTECPFVHPGENARRRDPRKYNYTCVPCPEFKKGACAKSDSCEYAHGVFESWLHPAQYRTRLCKDETGCSRKVCFFAHKPEELRPLYASTGSALPSPKATPVSSMDMSTLSPLALGSSPPMSPAAVTCSSPMGGNMWQSKTNITPPALQLPGSRLKTSVNARDLDLDMKMLGLESIRTQQQLRQQLIDEMAGLSSPSYWNNDNRMGDLKPTNLDDVFGSMDSQMLSQLQGLSPRVTSSTSSQLYSPSVPHLQGLSPKVSSNGSQMQSPTGLQMRQNMNQFQSSYSNISQSSSPMRKPSTYGFDSSAAVAQAVMNSRSAAAFAKRSQSFIDRSGMGHRAGGPNGVANSPPVMSSNNMSDWGSPDGKLEWGYNSEDTNKLKRSQSFGFRGGNGGTPTRSPIAPSQVNEPDVSWVHSLVKDVSSTGTGLYSSEQKHGGGARESIPPWLEQMYIDQERIVA